MVTDLSYIVGHETFNQSDCFWQKITILNTQRLVNIVLTSQKKSWKFGSVVLEFVDWFGDSNSE